MARRRGTARRFRRQVNAEALLRFNPERSSLRGALREAGQQRVQEISSANTSAEGIRTAARQARPVLRRTYGSASRSIDQSDRDADKILRTLAPGLHSDLAADFARNDTKATKHTLAVALASAIRDTTSREQDAAAGRSWAITAANTAYAQNVGNIRSRLQQLGRETGAFKQQRLGELGEAERGRHFQARQNRLGRRATARNQRRTQEATAARQEDAQAFQAEQKAKDRAAAAARARRGPGGKEATGPQYATFQTDVARARAIGQAVRQADPRLGRITVANLLLNGRDARQVVDSRMVDRLIAQGVPVSEARRRATRTVPAVRAVNDALAVTTAMDLVFDGRVSRTTARKLRRARGIRPTRLGFGVGPTPKPPRGVRPDTAGNPNVSRR